MRQYIDLISAIFEAGRARLGGETGLNGYAYKGGQFLPSTEAPPGTWRVKIKGKTKLVHNKQALIAPGQMALAPTPYSQSIFNSIREFVNVDADGRMALNPAREQAIEYYYPTKDDREELAMKIEMFNQGLRWHEVIPPGVEVIAKSVG